MSDSGLVLGQNYPNSFNPETWLPYRLGADADVTVRVHDISGRLVRQFMLGRQSAGDYSEPGRAIHWDGRDELGEQVSSGVYIYQFRAGQATATRRMLIVK